MASFNKVILMGNITRDVELRYLPNQTPCVDLGLAMNHKYKDKEDVCFVDVTFFGKQAETLAQYMSKGKPIMVEGRLQLDQWEDQNGNKRSKHKIFGERFTFVDAPQQQAPTNTGYSHPPQHQAPPATTPMNNDAPDGGDVPF